MAINFAVTAARVRQRAGARDAGAQRQAAAVDARVGRERRENELKAMGVVIPLSAWLGHNNGPDILQPTLFLGYQWRQAKEAAFRPPSHDMAVRWARMAEKLGLTYREFRLILLEQGRHPTEEDARRLKALRGA